jgi:chromosomal replication initiation ATPase DnaA
MTKKLKIATIVGTRPELIRLSRVMGALDRHCDHLIVHTGQNYDYELNGIFYEDLGLRQPDVFLEAAGDTAAENALFHLHNLTLAEGHSLLLTADRPAAHWGLTLPDLASRMQGTQATRLDAPDDRLLTALLAKLFADRQLIPTPDTIPYLVTRMDRSFDSARQLVAALDAAALAQGRPINRKLAADVMERFIQPGLLDNSPD